MKGDEENKAAVTPNAAAISGDTLSVNLDRMADEGRITQGDKALIVWFHTECRGKAMSLDEMGALIGYTSTTVSRLFNGRYDESRCGLIVCGTQSLETDLIQGELRDWLEQFKERCIRRLVLPKAPPEGDVMAALRGIRMNRYMALLMLAGNVAKKRGQELGWEHFMAAWKTVDR